MDPAGRFSKDHLDVFGNEAWDATHRKVQAKADQWRRQGLVGLTMASHAELAYTGIAETLGALDGAFKIRPER